jgi:hypothetical protein
MSATEADILPIFGEQTRQRRERESFMSQLRETIKTIHTAFVPVERQMMRNALKYGKANGWIASEAREARYGWVPTPRFSWEDDPIRISK